ncbi:MAG TPA: hypothetical protein VHY37_09555, partial [Tepidisphaeraceae bacterium]|nr:hypothetical protein [Tepidisphaeraceae bacterium]
PQTYQGGMQMDVLAARNFGGAAGDGMMDRQAQAQADEPLAPTAGPAAANYAARQQLADDAKALHGELNFVLPPQASGAKVGEAFEYTVHDVTLARQKSSMIPILAGAIRAQRLSIYNQSVLPNNPLLGARLTNTTGQYIMQGPITVLDHGIYAGDAQILDLPPDATRLISYGIDQRMQVNVADTRENTQLLTGKIVKGVLELTDKAMFSQTYVAKNNADADKTLLIEQPRRQDWDLIQPDKPMETTDALYRFEETIPPGKSASLTVEQQHTYGQAIAILPNDTSAIVFYSQNAAIPKPVQEALAKAATLKQAVTDTERQLAQLRQDKSDLANEQDRMRKDMSVVSPGTDYYKKLLQKLDDQETQFEKMETQEKQLQQQQIDQQKALEDYLAGLNVG